MVQGSGDKKEKGGLLVKGVHGNIIELHVPETRFAVVKICRYSFVQQAIDKQTLLEHRRNNDYQQP